MSVRSPSGVPVLPTVSLSLATGRLSPVSADSATSSVAARRSRPSAGTMSSASIETISPGTSCSAGISCSCPSRLTLALMIIICRRAATAAAAFPSCCRPSTARHPGSAFPVSNVLGPNRSARDAASAELRPCGPSTFSASSTWSARGVCHTGASSPGARAGTGAPAGTVTCPPRGISGKPAPGRAGSCGGAATGRRGCQGAGRRRPGSTGPSRPRNCCRCCASRR